MCGIFVGNIDVARECPCVSIYTLLILMEDVSPLTYPDCLLLLILTPLASSPACTPCTALRSQEQQKRFSPCCLLSPPPPPLFPPPPSLWRRHPHVSQSHVTFLLWNIWLLICPWVMSKLPHAYSVFWPLNDTVKTHSDGGTCLQEENGLTSPLRWVVNWDEFQTWTSLSTNRKGVILLILSSI